MKVTAVLLAAGQGTRMKSSLPKVLHPLCGKPMLWYSLEAVKQASTEKPVVVVGHAADQVCAFIGDAAECAVQDPQLGTAHAVKQAEPLVKGKADLVIVTYADMPLLRGETYQRLVETQQANPGPLTLLTVMAEDPRGFGRVVRNAEGSVQAIVEEVGATPEQLAIQELNVGAYCFRSDWLWSALERIEKNPHKGEYYLTDAAQIGRRQAMLSVAKRLLKAGIQTAIITMASQGCLVVQGEEIVRVYAPKVKAVDGSGAGATFSSGFIYGYLNQWSLEESVRFAIAAASLKVTHSGLTMSPIEEIESLAARLRVQRMIYRDDQFYTLKKLLSMPKNNPLFEEGVKFANLATQKLQFKRRLPSSRSLRDQARKKTT